MKNLFSITHNLFSKALSQESTIVLLAFISTTLVFGFIVYNYVESIPSYESTKLAANSVLLYYYNGRIWKIIIPIQVFGDNRVDLRPGKIRVTMSMGDGVSARFINISGVNDYSVYNGDVLLGGITSIIHSCTIDVEYYNGGSISSREVNMHVYFDEHGRIHVIIDDDNDGVIDSNFLVEFTSNAQTTVLVNPDNTYVLEVEKNSILPIGFLEYALAGSTKPNAKIRVIVSLNTYYIIEIPSITRGLQEIGILAIISRGNNDYYLSQSEAGSIIILVPSYVDSTKSSKLELSIYLSNTVSIRGELEIPQKLNGTGLIVLSGLKSFAKK